MNGKKGESMKRAIKTFKAILSLLLMGVVISVGSWAFAQEGGISGSVPDVIELSDITPNRTVNISTGGKSLLKEESVQTKEALSWETGSGKSYLIPALEIPAFLFLLNGYDRLAYPNSVEPSGEKTYNTNLSTFWDHLNHGPWVVDTDAFNVNQFMHPYQGSMYHGFARSAGLNYWESLLYTNAGSLLWEMGGETSNPSINDQFSSGISGSFFGEALFRMAGLVLERDGGKPGFWRELGAAVLSPSTGFNRLAFGERLNPCSRVIIRRPSGDCSLVKA